MPENDQEIEALKREIDALRLVLKCLLDTPTGPFEPPLRERHRSFIGMSWDEILNNAQPVADYFENELSKALYQKET